MKNTKELSWDSFDAFNEILEPHLPACGQGETFASQVSTTICKLVYKWFNDGNVFDNTYYLKGWANDLSSYANWLAKYIPRTNKILDRIECIKTKEEYTQLLYDLCIDLVTQPNFNEWSLEDKIGDVYNCDGFYTFSN